jgi:hypothetical protein
MVKARIVLLDLNIMIGSSLTQEHWTKLEKLARDQHSSLFILLLQLLIERALEYFLF